MQQKAVFTGNVLDSHVEVRMRFNMIRYARPVFQFPSIAVISQEWLDMYSNKFWALVDYEFDNMENLILTGLLPMDNSNFPPEGIDNKYYFYTTKFRIFVDDAADNFSIESLSGNGVLNFGSTHAAQHAVLGDELKDILERLISILKTGKVLTEIGPQSFMPPTQLVLQGIADDLDLILSAQNKLD